MENVGTGGAILILAIMLLTAILTSLHPEKDDKDKKGKL
jgi:hypothetical protein